MADDWLTPFLKVPVEPEGPCRDAGHPPSRPGWVCSCACGWMHYLVGRYI